jgi:hypothetical protein
MTIIVIHSGSPAAFTARLAHGDLLLSVDGLPTIDAANVKNFADTSQVAGHVALNAQERCKYLFP